MVFAPIIKENTFDLLTGEDTKILESLLRDYSKPKVRKSDE